MVKQKAKKLTIHTKQKQESFPQKALVPLFESPFDIWDDINRMFYDGSLINP